MQEQTAQGQWTIPDLVIVAVAGVLGSFLGVGVGLGGSVMGALLGQFALTTAAIYMLRRVRRRDLGRLGFEVEARDGVMLLLGAGLQVLFAIMFLPLALLVGLETEPQSLSSEIMALEGGADRIALLLLIGLVGPILEEIMFRGILMDALASRFGTRAVVLGSSGAFAAFHMVGVSTEQPLESAVVLVPQLFLFGMILAYLRLTRKRLGPAIFTHAGFNLLSLTVILFFPELL